MGWWNIDILYQMFKNGVVYHRAPDHGPHGSGYPPGTNKGLTQDQSHIQYKEKAKAKYGTPATRATPAKSSTRRPRPIPRPIVKDKKTKNQRVSDYLKQIMAADTETKLTTIQQNIASDNRLNDDDKSILQLNADGRLDELQNAADDESKGNDNNNDRALPLDSEDDELTKLKEELKNVNRNIAIIDNNPTDLTNTSTYQENVARKKILKEKIEELETQASSANMDDLHPFVMKPAAPQLHMQKLHMQTSMEKLDLEPAMETVPDDVHVQAVQPMKCGDKMACKSHETEHAHGDMKCKHEAAGAKTGNKKKKKEKKSEESTYKQVAGAIRSIGSIFGRQHCDSCGELHDGDHDCELEAVQAMWDGYDSEGQALEKPRCASVGLANRKLNELQ